MMVYLKVLPGYGLPGNFARWRGRKGKKFATRIGKRRRDLITGFVVRTTRALPVSVSLMKLDIVRPYAAHATMIGDRRYVGFVFGQFFILIEYKDLNERIQKEVGETNLTRQELINMVCN